MCRRAWQSTLNEVQLHALVVRALAYAADTSHASIGANNEGGGIQVQGCSEVDGGVVPQRAAALFHMLAASQESIILYRSLHTSCKTLRARWL